MQSERLFWQRHTKANVQNLRISPISLILAKTTCQDKSQYSLTSLKFAKIFFMKGFGANLN